VHRGDVDDLAAARGLSPTGEFALAEKRAVKIGVVYPVDFLGCHFGVACAAAHYAGSVDQDVGGAEFTGNRLEQACDAFFIPNVGLPNDRPAACTRRRLSSAPASPVWKVTATFAPAFANSSAIAWPIPESEPVIRATLLSSFSIRYASVLDVSLGEGSPAQFMNADLRPRVRAIT